MYKKLTYRMLSFTLLTGVVLFLAWPVQTGTSGPQDRSGDQKASPQLEPGTHRGTVITTMDSGGYTYIEFEENGVNLWAAAPAFKVAVGDTIEFSGALPMKDFRSNKLDKTFASILFVNQVKVGDSPLPETGEQTLPEGHIPIADTTKRDVTVEPGSVPKADGGHTIAECYLQRDALEGKNVTVRGRVVKFTMKILGRNWVHIQDGTGEEGANDLTVTTKAEVDIGDLILVTGTLSLNKDFGAGYVYPLIVEEASITIEKRPRQTS
jgi:hypothetical protein